MIKNNRNLILVLAFGLSIVGVGISFMRSPDAPSLEPLPGKSARSPSAESRFVTSDACRECHQRHYTTWHDSYHRTMTQPATPETVLSTFDGVRLESRGQSFQLSRKGDEFFATRVTGNRTSAASEESRPIVMTTGSHSMQTYWVQAGRELRQLPWFFNIEEQLWIPSQDSFLTPPSDTPIASARWNDTCIKCHSTGGVPGYIPSAGFNTRVAELGISCEACHGPGERHVNFHRATKSTDPVTNAAAAMVSPEKLSHVAASQICGQCHSSSQVRDRRGWLRNGSPYRPGEDHKVSFRHAEVESTDPEDAPYLQDSFWSDGTCRVGGDELLGLQDSACFQHGEMSCLSCHSMHDSDPSDQLKVLADSNEACLQCHDTYRDQIEEHTHHSIGSSGSQCFNCHMPHTSFALLKAIRSHRVDSPQTTDSTQGSRPNACNLCHLDKTLHWTATHLSDWYDAPEITMSETDRNTSAALLWLLRGNAIQRAIVAWGMSWQPAREISGSEWQAPFLAETLADPYSVVRFVAWRSLKHLPGFKDFQYDFLTPEGERSRNRAVDHWIKQARTIDDDRAIRVLLTPAGELDSQATQNLQAERDDRPVNILE
jgi:predicted CXXCH cytochrome family protein